MFTAVATKPVLAESSRAAADNRLENATLITGNRGVVLSRKFVSMLPNNVGHLGPTSTHRLLVDDGGVLGVWEIQRAWHPPDHLSGNVEVA